MANLIDVASGAAYTLAALTAADTQIAWRSAAASAKTTTIPAAAAVNNGYTLGIADAIGTAAAYPITITPAAGTIGGQTNFVLAAPYASVVLAADGSSTDWIIRART